MILSLTSMGKKRAKIITSGGPEFAMISALEESGPSELEELAKDMKVSIKGVREIAVKLAKKGYIKKEE